MLIKSSSKLFKFCFFSSVFLLFSCVKIQEKTLAIKAGDETWSLKEVQDYIELRLPDFPNKKNIKEGLLDEVVFQIFLENWAKKNNKKTDKIQLTKEERLLFSKDKRKLKALKRFKRHLNLNQLLQKEFEKKIPTPSLKEQKLFYKKTRGLFLQSSLCQLDQILVDNEKLAQALYSKIKAGESFSKLSHVYSLKKGPGWIQKGQWDLFDKACFEEKEALSSVLKSPYGWHIFLRKAKKDSKQKSFSESQEKIIKALKRQALPAELQKWLKEESLKNPVFMNKKLLDQIKIQDKRDGV